MAEITPELREKIIKSFTDEQRKVYDNLVGDKKRLANEFKLCRQFYGDVIDVINKKECGQQVRLFLQHFITVQPFILVQGKTTSAACSNKYG